jgi:hypothetical protein
MMHSNVNIQTILISLYCNIQTRQYVGNELLRQILADNVYTCYMYIVPRIGSSAFGITVVWNSYLWKTPSSLYPPPPPLWRTPSTSTPLTTPPPTPHPSYTTHNRLIIHAHPIAHTIHSATVVEYKKSLVGNNGCNYIYIYSISVLVAKTHQLYPYYMYIP